VSATPATAPARRALGPAGGEGLGAIVGDGTAETIFGPAGLQERVTNATAQAQYAQGDEVGSVRLVTSGTGGVVGSATYEPWGTARSGSASLGGFGFTGEQTDSATGLVYLRARMYDPATGSFLQQDSWPGTLDAPQSQNGYGYTEGRPTTYTDPSGHIPAFDPGGSPGNDPELALGLGRVLSCGRVRERRGRYR
jgi:RHS repeat-associated protein